MRHRANAITARADDVEICQRFSLVHGGPLHGFGRALGLVGRRRGLWDLAVVLSIVAWLPLAILALVHPVPADGLTVSFWLSPGVHARLLVAMPLLFVAEGLFDARIRQALRTMVAARLVPAHRRADLNSALRQANRWRDAWWLEAGLMCLTLILVWRGPRLDLQSAIPTWRVLDGELTRAGWWYSAVSWPLFQFLLWRWCARLLVWWSLLWRIGRLDLQLVPTHPDLAGGLGGLGVAHSALAPLSFGVSAVVAGTLAEDIAYGGVPVHDVIGSLAGLIAGSTLILVAPLLQFTHHLFDVRQRGLIEYGGLATGYVRAFDDKWLRQPPPPADALLGSADLQSLADLANSYSVIDRMHLMPITWTQVLVLVGAAAVPAAPLILFVIPFDELVLRAARALLNL